MQLLADSRGQLASFRSNTAFEVTLQPDGSISLTSIRNSSQSALYCFFIPETTSCPRKQNNDSFSPI
jgi:hypothetical protein